jgi:uncharacterized membrane protein YfcA
MPGFESLTPLFICWIALVIVLAGFVQGALGLGFPLIATPLIAFFTDIRTAVIIVLLPCVATILVTMWKAPLLMQALKRFWTMPLWAFGGAAVGTRLFIEYPDFPYALLLAGIIVVYLNLGRFSGAQSRMVNEHPQLFGAAAGIAAGLCEGTANVAAPPLVIYYLALGLQPAMLVQALNICFITGKSTQFVTLGAAGGVTAAQWLTTAPLMVLGAAGALHGMKVRSRLDAPTYRVWLRRALFGVAVMLCAQYAYGLARG